MREDLVTLDPPALLGGSCSSCGGVSFPVERFCAYCGSAGPAPKQLAASGHIYSFTIARFAAPGYAGPVPYAVGVVELDDGIRVASTLIATPLESLRIDAPVRFRLLDVETEDGVVTSYAFEQDPT